MVDEVEVAVVGGGPAGLALAAACTDQGIDTALVAPDRGAGWPQRYGVWRDELIPLGLQDVVARFWPVAIVQAGTAPQRVSRGYALLDNEATYSRLLARVRRRVDAPARAIRQGPRGPRLALDGARELAARVVVDATGHRPALVEPRGSAPAFQSAWGVTAHVSEPLTEPGAMMLMDLRDPVPLPRGADPTFLYAMDTGDGRWFLEETSLTRRRPLPFEVLEARLRARLADRGLELSHEADEEHCLIPMGRPIPRRDQPVVGYGAAASMVHPASGYQVGEALRRAPTVAAALAEGLADPHASPRTLAGVGWAAVWPEDRRRQRALQDYGLEVLLALDPEELRRFFAAFFALPETTWCAYLSGGDSVSDLRRSMLAVFRRTPRLRGALLAPARHAELRRALRSGLGIRAPG
ncbi:lycopene cyclase family protein [Egibacter rhizosphaerae]|uniref:lycopene cyclase family protein n=1 Tax=Egibacter rhizosphaerae TaxID=1670831 RepID=UPI0013F17A20|nr:lycopene cyclase family protein [Egibacter rhizosphaerae]